MSGRTDEPVEVRFHCHECNNSFDSSVSNRWGTYEFVRCPACGSARTTLASGKTGP